MHLAFQLIHLFYTKTSSEMGLVEEWLSGKQGDKAGVCQITQELH